MMTIMTMMTMMTMLMVAMDNIPGVTMMAWAPLDPPVS